MTKTISMKKLYFWASQYPEWKRSKGFNWDNKKFEKRISIIVDFLTMLWEKRNS
jgi:hypothetical protein